MRINGWHEERSELWQKLNDLRWRFNEAKKAGNQTEVDAVLAQSRPLQARLREMEAAERFRATCPITWTHTATDEAIEAKISNPVLRRFAGESDTASRSALLLGPSQIGKSTTLALALRRALRVSDLRKGQVHWFYARALAQAARQYPLGEGVCPEVDRAMKADLLVLDDLGLERDPAELIDVIHTRYERERVTWTTSGMSMAELRERYGEALVRRLVEGRAEPGRVVSCFSKQLEAVGR